MSANSIVPQTMLAWPLYGAGMEKLGKDNQPVVLPVPENGDDELLVRIDAIGLCFSDVKLIRAGEEPPRVISPNLATEPVIPGHEAVMTVVKVGKKLQDQFRPGQRYIIQADIYVHGQGFAYGYAINGGMAQYSVIDQRVLNGDEGCYLLPLDEQTPAAVAALMEPWTCVMASYMIKPRTAPQPGGDVLVVCGDQGDYVPGELLTAAKPGSVTLLHPSPATLHNFEAAFGGNTVNVITAMADVKFDDIFLCNTNRAVTETGARLGKRHAVISLIGNFPDEEWRFDVGSIHYEGWFYQGATGNDLSAAYNRNVRSTYRSGGTCWLPGGAGAMGQMHTQLAVESPQGPSRILVTDMDNARIENVRRQLQDKIAARKIEFVTMNPAQFASPEEFEQAVRAFAPEGFDDIIMLVPVVPVLNQAARFLKPDGMMNIFAGIPAGKESSLNVRMIAAAGVRYIGSSGSTTAHLRHTLQMAESGQLRPVSALAAIGGMRELKNGLQALIDARFPGKTVIFPSCEDMPLVAVQQLESLAPEIAATLDGQGQYTLATEAVLLRRYGK
ncbi:MAG: alcohol dehydrogenase catalytic domain-containing protein [Victivallales bacterium]|nr:alcohol dehydrogenase catalytic domain-containing protein [Victivallales bacterium]